MTEEKIKELSRQARERKEKKREKIARCKTLLEIIEEGLIAPPRKTFFSGYRCPECGREISSQKVWPPLNAYEEHFHYVCDCGYEYVGTVTIVDGDI